MVQYEHLKHHNNEIQVQSAVCDEKGINLDTYYAKRADLPTVNDATLTIQKNGTDVATFSANASSNVVANISVPAAANNATLTIQRNSTNVATFTADASTDVIANISVPNAANDGVLTIQRNGTTLDTFTADQSGNTTVNIIAPNITISQYAPQPTDGSNGDIWIQYNPPSSE